MTATAANNRPPLLESADGRKRPIMDLDQRELLTFTLDYLESENNSQNTGRDAILGP